MSVKKSIGCSSELETTATRKRLKWPQNLELGDIQPVPSRPASFIAASVREWTWSFS
jgi:hypothetical protein